MNMLSIYISGSTINNAETRNGFTLTVLFFEFNLTSSSLVIRQKDES